MRRIAVSLGLVLGLLVAIVLYFGVHLVPIDLITPTDEGVIYIDNLPIRVTVADSIAERTKGLSGRLALKPGEGMLFVFPSDDRYGFWMKDMRFSIDMIWISQNGIVTDIDEMVSPNTYPNVYKPDEPVRYVLEVPAGFSRSHNIVVGSILSF